MNKPKGVANRLSPQKNRQLHDETEIASLSEHLANFCQEKNNQFKLSETYPIKSGVGTQTSPNTSSTAFSRKLFTNDFEEEEEMSIGSRSLFIISETQQNNEVDIEKPSVNFNENNQMESDIVCNQNEGLGKFRRKLFDNSIRSTPTKLGTENIQYSLHEESYVDSRALKKIFKSEAEAPMLSRNKTQTEFTSDCSLNLSTPSKKQGQRIKEIFPESRFLTDYEKLEVFSSSWFLIHIIFQ